MNVLHVHSGNLFGGVERMLETMAAGNAGAVDSSFALSFDGPVADAFRATGAPVHLLGPVRARRIREVLAARRQLRSVLASRSWTAALVHSAWSQAIFGPAILASGVPLIRWLHAPQPGPRWMEAWSSRSRPALVICNSRYTQDAAAGRLGSVPSVVHYPPASCRTIPSHSRSQVRSALGTRADAVVIALLARLEPGKGHGVLVDALAGVPGPRWEAWIIGGVQQPSEQAYLEALQGRAESAGISGRVRFLGQRSDVAELLDAADIYCQPNQSADSFGLSFVEALAAGLPVVTTRMGAAAEIVTPACGVLLDSGSSADLAGAIRRLVDEEDERRRMAIAARARAQVFCDVPRSLQQLAGELAAVTAPDSVLT